MSAVFDDRVCKLGEGPLWHPERRQLFWFDILGKRLMTRDAEGPRSWQFDEHVSAAGWVDRDRLLIASEAGLWRFDLRSGRRAQLAALEEDNPATRSNDGRADPWGGFWIGTMGKNAEPGAGAIYRLYKGEIRHLISNVTISNAICFAPDRACAYFADTAKRRVMRQPLEPGHGWPAGDAAVFLDLDRDGLNPDGAVIDAAGNLWLAQWGAGRVAVYATDGRFVNAVAFAARQTSCPAFGGDDLTTLFCTSASVGLGAAILNAEPENGMTFAAPNAGKGQAEHRVIL